MMLQEGGSHQTEQQMSEMIKENLTLSVKKGKSYILNKNLTFSCRNFFINSQSKLELCRPKLFLLQKNNHSVHILLTSYVQNYKLLHHVQSIIPFLFASFFRYFTQLRIKSSFVREDSTFHCLFHSSWNLLQYLFCKQPT